MALLCFLLGVLKESSAHGILVFPFCVNVLRKSAMKDNSFLFVSISLQVAQFPSCVHGLRESSISFLWKCPWRELHFLLVSMVLKKALFPSCRSVFGESSIKFLSCICSLGESSISFLCQYPWRQFHFLLVLMSLNRASFLVCVHSLGESSFLCQWLWRELPTAKWCADGLQF